MRLKTYFTYLHYLQVCSLYEQLVSSAHLQCSSTWTATSPGLTVRKTIFLPYVSSAHLQCSSTWTATSPGLTVRKTIFLPYVSRVQLQCSSTWTATSPGLTVRKTIFLPYVSRVQLQCSSTWTATSPGLTVRKTIFLPYVSRVKLQRALEARPSSEKGTRDHRCSTLRVGNYVTHRPASLQFQIGDSGQAPGQRRGTWPQSEENPLHAVLAGSDV